MGWFPISECHLTLSIAARAESHMPRDNFSQPVKTELSLRAAHFCSNPRCLRLTAGPRSGVLRGLATGHAAHICAASRGGPRYDLDQSEAE